MGGPLAVRIDFLPRNHDIREDGNSALPRTKLQTATKVRSNREGGRGPGIAARRNNGPQTGIFNPPYR